MEDSAKVACHAAQESLCPIPLLVERIANEVTGPIGSRYRSLTSAGPRSGEGQPTRLLRDKATVECPGVRRRLVYYGRGAGDSAI
jgi:hypothetical protein